MDEILGAQIVSGNKHGLGFDCGASTSKNEGKFVQGKTLLSINPTVYRPTPMNSAPKIFVPQRKTIHICHFCGIMGHIRPHCNKLRNQLRSQQRKKHSSPQQVKTKPISVRKFDFCYNVVLTTL